MVGLYQVSGGIEQIGGDNRGLSLPGPRLSTAMTKPIVSIVFRDIVGTADWTVHEDVECLPVEVIGFLVYEDEDTVKIATARTPDNEYSAVHAIPTGCITEIGILIPNPPAPLSALSDSGDNVYSLATGSHVRGHNSPSEAPPDLSQT